MKIRFLTLVLALTCLGQLQAQTGAADVFVAIHLGDVSAVRSMLENEPAQTMNATHAGGISPLHYAVALDRMEIAYILLQAGMPNNVRTDKKTTPLHWAADKEKHDCLRLLLKEGAAVGDKAANGWTALHFSAKRGDAAAIGYLLDAGADINGADNSGHTPLHIASAGNQLKAVKVLLEKGADHSGTNAAGQQPVNLATSEEVRMALVAAGAAAPRPTVESPPARTAPETSPAGTTAEAADTRPGLKLTQPLPRSASVIRAAEAGTAPPLRPRINLEDPPAATRPAAPATQAEPKPDAVAAVDPETGETIHTLRLIDGSIYRGTLRRDRFHGQGSMEQPGGHKYVGEWNRGRKQGQGTFSYPNGDVYAGEWDNDMPHGKGIYQYGNGGRVEGTWRKGVLRRGEGIYVSSDGARHQGVWRNNELIESRPITTDE